MSREFSEKIRQKESCFTKKFGLLGFRQTGLVQKIGTFTEIRYTYESQFSINQCKWIHIIIHVTVDIITLHIRCHGESRTLISIFNVFARYSASLPRNLTLTALRLIVNKKLNKHRKKTKVTKMKKMLGSLLKIVKFNIEGDFTSKHGCIELCNSKFLSTRLPRQVFKLMRYCKLLSVRI